jgi:GNAT superfamily N-acetyltransferase
VDYSLVAADAADVDAIANLHVESWRSAYRGLLPDSFLDGPVVDDRVMLWRERLNTTAADRQLVLKAVSADMLAGFVCVLLDGAPALGPLLDNLHVKPTLKGTGIGSRLFRAALEWVERRAPGQPMHLWVLEGNLPARRFYDRHGGEVAEQRMRQVVPGILAPELRYEWKARGRVPS